MSHGTRHSTSFSRCSTSKASKRATSFVSPRSNDCARSAKNYRRRKRPPRRSSRCVWRTSRSTTPRPSSSRKSSAAPPGSRVRALAAGGGRAQGHDGAVLTTRGSVFVDEFSNTLVVRDIQRGIDTARELVRRLDVQTPQVLIESNIVEATTDFARDLGVQWGYRSLNGPQTGNTTGVNFPGSIGLAGAGLGTGGNGVPFIADFPAAINPGGGSALDH